MSELRLILVDPDPLLCRAFERTFEGLPNVEVVNGRFEQLPDFDCMVSAANSFGLMDGGVDAAIVRFFGPELMERVQQQIRQLYLGEQPVGTSIIVETGDPEHPYIAHTPTMRIPMSVAHTEHAYLAMWGMLTAVHRHNQRAERQIQIVACPGLCTATGQMFNDEAAGQMALAYRNFLNPPQLLDWEMALIRHQRITLTKRVKKG